MYENIPIEMKKNKQWVCVKSNSKIPFTPNGEIASITDSTTWAKYDEVVGKYDGIGYVFNGDYVAIDLDKNVFDEDNFLTEYATNFINNCNSYTEISKSGRGLHIIMRGCLPFLGKNNRDGVEIYKSSRYFIMTGNNILNNGIVENQKAIDWILDTYFKDKTTNNYSNKIYEPIYNDIISNGKIRIRPTYPIIQNGSRNMCMTSVAGGLRTLGYTLEQMFTEMQIVNKIACRPPLSTSEIRTICNSICRYKGGRNV